MHAAHLPLSILVVGIGKASFASAASLDCDAGFLRARNGDIVTRDVVQFVAFRNVQDDGAALARAVLAELPGQLLMYMRCALSCFLACRFSWCTVNAQFIARFAPSDGAALACAVLAELPGQLLMYMRYALGLSQQMTFFSG